MTYKKRNISTNATQTSSYLDNTMILMVYDYHWRIFHFSQNLMNFNRTRRILEKRISAEEIFKEKQILSKNYPKMLHVKEAEAQLTLRFPQAITLPFSVSPAEKLAPAANMTI